MPDTTNRPTAWAVLYDHLDPVSTPDLDRALDALIEHGYVIVHPDDVPKRKCPNPHQPLWRGEVDGWNDCRAHIFGDDQ